MKYGRSLSFCVKDILSGKVKKEDVGKIVTPTAFENDESWQKGIQSYCRSYWYEYSLAECHDLIKWLRENGKIEQLRLKNGSYQAYLYKENWADSYREVIESLVRD